MSLEFEDATKDAAKARICLTGPAGSGKTYSALMLAFALGVIDAGAVSLAEFWKLHGYGQIGSLRMSDCVADVVGKSTDGEGKLIGVSRITEEIDDEISRTDVVRQIGERCVAEGIVADVLNDAAAIGVCAGVLKLSGGEGGVTA